MSEEVCAAADLAKTGVFCRALPLEADRGLLGALVSQALVRICIARRARELQDHAVSIS